MIRFTKKSTFQVQFLVIAARVSLSVVVCGTSLIRLSSPNTPVLSTTTEPPSSLVSPTMEYPYSLVSPQQNSSSPVLAASVAPTNSTVASAKPYPGKLATASSHLAYGHLSYAQAESLGIGDM